LLVIATKQLRIFHGHVMCCRKFLSMYIGVLNEHAAP